MQRAEAPAFGLVRVAGARLRQGVIAIEMDEGVHVAIERSNAL